ncbi:MAG: LysR substrate-binding domain-containing protein [Pseudomonadota bacterium]|uniref:LysR substrate-binding domain-containing protein n=1 Tax=Sphingobium yanoikuyae TaxID=13690 RepID=UPI00241BF53B|nr:LysR substrate-binding domain-containing protein [Sphingobium yanoikuyae]
MPRATSRSSRSGALALPFPEWQAQEGMVHLVFPTRTGLPPLVRAWIDHLAAHFSNGDILSP